MNNVNIYAFADETSPSIDKQIIAMKRNGLQGLEVRTVDGKNVSEITLEKARELKSKMDDAGLKVWSIGSPIGKIDIEKDDIPAHFELLKHTLEVAKVLGAENIRLFSFYIPQGKNPDDYTDLVIDSVRQMVEICKSYGINACHENEKGIFGDTPERCKKLFDAIPDLKGIFDFANYVQCGVDTLAAWDLLKTNTYYIHVKDCLNNGTVVTAGNGDGNIFPIVKNYIKAGGAHFTMEPHLTVFAGLAKLEREGDTSVIANNTFPDADTAFDTACNCFKAVLKKVEEGKVIRLGIIGLGNMGSTHAHNITAGKCPEITLSAVADTKPKRLDWARANLKGVEIFDDPEKMLDSGLIDSCLVCVPHYDHPKYAIECMKRKIHVMVEKPAGVYTKQVSEMNRVAAEHPDVVFGMMFNQRTNCVYRKMRELIQSGKYGNIRRVNWIITNWYRSQCYYDSGDWRATWSGEGGGVLLNQCPHQLDLWQWICGMPKKVYSHMHFGLWHDIEVEDDVTTYVEYENGATGVFITTTGDGCGTNRFEVQMDKAKIVVENDTLTLTEFKISEPEFSKTNTSPFGSIETQVVPVELDGRNPQHIGVLNAWAAAILHDEPLIARGEEGINGLTLSNAMHLSAFLGKEIELPFDEDFYYEELMRRVATSRRKTNVREVVADTNDSYKGTK